MKSCRDAAQSNDLLEAWVTRYGAVQSSRTSSRQETHDENLRDRVVARFRDEHGDGVRCGVASLVMNYEDQIKLTREVYAVVLEEAASFYDNLCVGGGLAYLLGAILNDQKEGFEVSEWEWALHGILKKHFPEEHPVWGYIKVLDMTDAADLFSVLHLVLDEEDMKRFPVTEIETWGREARAQAMHWAQAVHLHASDNDDVAVPVPPKPDFLKWPPP